MKRFLFIISIVAAATFFTGCKKFLDTVPDNRTEIDDSDKVRKLLANAYPRKTFAAILEARCDDMSSFGTTFSGGQMTESFECMRAGFYWMSTVAADNDDTYERFWEDCYRSIAYANFALEALDKFGDEWDANTVKLLRAEARVCRAYAHFNLVTLFSNFFATSEQTGEFYHNAYLGVPYVTVPEDEVFKKYERGTIASVMTAVEKDLFEELNNLGSSANYEVPKFRFTRDAALVLAVRLSLYKRDYDNVIKYADMLLPSAGKWVTNGQNADLSPKKYVAEDDVAYQWFKSNLLNLQEFRLSGTDLYQGGLYYVNPENSSYKLMSEVESITWRATLGTLLTSYQYNMNVMNKLVSTNVTGGGFAFPMLQFSNDPTAFMVKYYEDMLLVNETAGIGYVYLKVILFRLEEVLLARAEAYAMTGRFEDAMDDLNMYVPSKIFNHRYATHRLDRDKMQNYYSNQLSMTDTYVNNSFNKFFFSHFTNAEQTVAKLLILTIMDFRRAEFFYEGMRYFDILRWNIPVTHTDERSMISRTLWPDDDNRILQLPETAVLHGLELNPMENIREPWPGINY